MTTDSPSKPLLFTAFEPSGDEHAALVIRELKRRDPALSIFAWGGPRMKEAGATIICETGADAVMGLPGPSKILEHIRLNKSIARWLDENTPAAHIPVDSPGANFSVCKLAKARQIRVIHLVAPQLWAWGSWRIGKLRRLTNHVLCVLPFEERWFQRRGVSATFVGHPVFADPLQIDAPDQTANLPSGAPRLALMPGSRPSEITRNAPLLIAAYRKLKRRQPRICAAIVAASDSIAERLRAMMAETGGEPDDLSIITRAVDAVVNWCDLAVTVSGTITLRIARQRKPMVVLYRMNPALYHGLARWLLATDHIALPNIVAGRRIIPELIPYTGGPRRLVEEVERLVDDETARAEQSQALGVMIKQFESRSAATLAADEIERIALRG